MKLKTLISAGILVHPCFQCSIDNHQLQYVQYLGDRDNKSCMSVKSTYPDIENEKQECVGHYQKRVGTRLRT